MIPSTAAHSDQSSREGSRTIGFLGKRTSSNGQLLLVRIFLVFLEQELCVLLILDEQSRRHHLPGASEIPAPAACAAPSRRPQAIRRLVISPLGALARRSGLHRRIARHRQRPPFPSHGSVCVPEAACRLSKARVEMGRCGRLHDGRLDQLCQQGPPERRQEW